MRKNNFISYKLKRFLSILYAIFISICIYSQEDIYVEIKALPIGDSLISQKLDSLLLKNIRESNFNDFSTVSNRYASWLYNRKRVSKSLETLNLSIKLHRGDTTSLQKKYYKLGIYLYNTGQFQKSLQTHQETLNLTNNTTNSLIADTHIEIGRVYYKKGDFQAAIRHYDIAEAILLELNEPQKLIRCYLNAYNTYKSLDVNKVKDKILVSLFKADSISNTHPIPYIRKYSIKRALGDHYARYGIKDTSQGLLHLNKALELATKRQDSTRIAQVMNLL